MLNGISYIGKLEATKFTLGTQDDVVGGFAKYEDGFPGILMFRLDHLVG